MLLKYIILSVEFTVLYDNDDKVEIVFLFDKALFRWKSSIRYGKNENIFFHKQKIDLNKI